DGQRDSFPDFVEPPRRTSRHLVRALIISVSKANEVKQSHQHWMFEEIDTSLRSSRRQNRSSYVKLSSWL
ncbi:MAG TPA: hypothetical protein PKY94_09645, partial [Smithellaceae bacterium]|nr:hypothetical protein [Smithellaceae bacterium]